MARDLFVVLVLLAVLCSGDARAKQAQTTQPTTGDQTEAAATLFDQARELLNRARFSEAVRLLERAAGLARKQGEAARIQLYLGIGHWLEGSSDLAHAAFVAALTKDPTLSLDVKRHKPKLVAAFRRARNQLVGWVDVRGTPGAAAQIDGQPSGRLPVSRKLPIGAHTVRVTLGKRSFSQTVTVKPDDRVVVTANLPSPPPPKRAPTRAPRKRIWTWVAAGSAVVAASVGLGLGIAAHAANDEYWSTTDYQRYEELSDSVPQKATAANVAFGVAGALAVGAVLLLLLE